MGGSNTNWQVCTHENVAATRHKKKANFIFTRGALIRFEFFLISHHQQKYQNKHINKIVQPEAPLHKQDKRNTCVTARFAYSFTDSAISQTNKQKSYVCCLFVSVMMMSRKGYPSLPFPSISICMKKTENCLRARRMYAGDGLLPCRRHDWAGMEAGIVTPWFWRSLTFSQSNNKRFQSFVIIIIIIP